MKAKQLPTKDEMLYQVWFAMIGSNGEGVCSRVKNLEDGQDEIKSSLQHFSDTRAQTCPIVAGRKQRREWKFNHRTVFMSVVFAGLAAGPAWIEIIEKMFQ